MTSMNYFKVHKVCNYLLKELFNLVVVLHIMKQWDNYAESTVKFERPISQNNNNKYKNVKFTFTLIMLVH